MSGYTIEQVKQLREETGAGMMDAKNALEKAGGDYKKALEAVKAQGLARAEKKSAEREAKEGCIASYVHSNGKIAALAQLLCETDFVAKNEEFGELAREIAMQVAAMDPKDEKELLEMEMIKRGEETVEVAIKQLSGKIGEKIALGEFTRMTI
ncbi:translation elongation factor Ts [Microgenomates group bacterium]|nr:translation elongation factor Ts [Microgenomates group bacterium]